MFHQPHNSFGNKIYNAFVYTNAEYGEHFHKSYELIYCMGERVKIGFGDSETELKHGEFLLVFPYKKHSFKTQGEKEKIWIGVFSADYIKEFDKEFMGKEPKNAKFQVDSQTLSYLQTALLFEGSPDKYTLKGALYAVLGSFCKQTEFIKRQDREQREITLKIVRYVEENFKENITLHTAAQELGYNFQYLSRVFHQCLGVNFREIVNQYRFDHARMLLEKGELTITQAALDSGFQSVRNFNRVYKEKTGQTPKAFSDTNN